MEVTEKLWIPEDVICGYNIDIHDRFNHVENIFKRKSQDFEVDNIQTFKLGF